MENSNNRNNTGKESSATMTQFFFTERNKLIHYFWSLSVNEKRRQFILQYHERSLVER